MYLQCSKVSYISFCFNLKEKRLPSNDVADQNLSHPAPLPIPAAFSQVFLPNAKLIPPKLEMYVEAEKRQNGTAVVIKLNIPTYNPEIHESISEYELYGYRENDCEQINSDSWKFVSDT